MFQIGVEWNVKEFGPVMREAAVALSQNIRTRARQDMAANVSARRVKGVTTTFAKIPGGYKVDVIQRPAFGKVWEYGGVSVGKPLLWIAQAGSPRRAKAFAGKLFQPRGSRVLITRTSRVPIRGMFGTGAGQTQVKYIGVPSVTHRQKLHFRQIATEEANKMSQLIIKYLG